MPEMNIMLYFNYDLVRKGTFLKSCNDILIQSKYMY